MSERRALRPGASYPRSILSLDAEPGSLSASAVCSLEGLLIGGGKGGRGPKRRESPIDSLEPHPGQDPEAESSSGKLSGTSFPSAPSSSSSPAEGSLLGEERGEAAPGCLPKAPGHTQPYGGVECGPTWKMIGTVPTEEHPRGIQHASSETSVENVKVCGYILLFKI